MAKVMDIDVTTGEVTERDMTAEELADYQARQDEVSANQEE